MRGQRKLIIQHFVNEEVKKLGKSPTGFPIQVRVRNKDHVTVFSSRLGLRFAKSEVLGEEKIREYKEISERIIQQELKYIIDVKNYFEETLEIEFNPKILVNENIEIILLDKLINYFDTLFVTDDFEKFLIKYSPSAAVLSDTYRMKKIHILDFLQAINLDAFERIISMRDYRIIFSYYIQLLELFDVSEIGEINLISFRLLEVNKDSDLGRFKETFGKWFDTKIIDLLKSDKNYSSFFK